MRTASNAVPDGHWHQVLAEAASRDGKWLILPRQPCHNDEHEFILYAALYRSATRIAGALRALGGNDGDRVVVVADNSAEAATLLLATLVSGLIAVPVTPRTMVVPVERWSSRLREICDDCQPRFVVGSQARLPAADVHGAAKILSFEQLLAAGHDACHRRSRAADDVALIQYTSGTTGRPLGVELTHASIFHNLAMIGAAIDVRADDVVLTWLPLFHDMGLIGSLLAATYFHLPLVLMAPHHFLVRPESWLWAISRYGATFCAAPNSAYQACATAIPDRKLEDLDLRSWRLAFNGAECVHAPTIEAFCERFARYGFAQTAMYPVYGLAENTLATTFPRRGSLARVDWVDRERLEVEGRAVSCDRAAAGRARGVVSVGSALPGQGLRIVDAAGHGVELPERAVGAVEVRGRCVMRGYHRAADASSSALAHDGWLRTGDLGYLSDGQLYLTGRSKELINRSGRKYDASDIRAVVRAIPGVRGGIVAAFGVPNDATGTEDLVIMAETSVRDAQAREALQAEIAARIHQALSIRPDEVVLVGAGVVPHTTSGKVRNGQARAVYYEARHLGDAQVVR